jgi:hypothetical protein
VTAQRRRWQTDKQRNFADQLATQHRSWRDEHLAKHGPHTCTPDPADPWSTCDLIPKGEAS